MRPKDHLRQKPGPKAIGGKKIRKMICLSPALAAELRRLSDAAGVSDSAWIANQIELAKKPK